MARDQVLFDLEGWPGGFNRSVDETALVKEELLDAYNVEIDSRGDIARRAGYTDATLSGSPAQLTSVGSWWPNTASNEILVGRSAATDDIAVARSQGAAAPYAIDVIDAGSATGSYTTPTIDYFHSSFVSLNSDDLYVVNRRGSDTVYKLVWVNDSTAPTVSSVAKASFDILEPVIPKEEGRLAVNATGGTYDIGSGADMFTVPWGSGAAEIQAGLRELDSYSSTLTVTSLGSGNYDIKLASIDPTIVTDDTNLTGTATYTVTSSQIEPDDQFPAARFALTKNSRVWVANVTHADGEAHPSRVYYSDALKPEKWYSLQYFDFTPDDGSEITAFVPYGEAILVFKNRNISILTGKTEETLAISMLDEEIGTVSPKSVSVVGSSMYFFDRDRGVWFFNGAEFKNIAEQILDYLLDGINHDYAFTAAAFQRRGVYYLSVPWGSSKTPNRTFCYDIEGDLWYEWTYGFNQAATLRGEVFAAVDGLAGFAQLFDGDDDDGTAITAYATTGWLAPAGDGAQHRIRRLDASFADEGTSQSVTVSAYRDYESSAFATDTVIPDGTALFQRMGGFGNKRWKQIKFKVANVAGSAFRLNRLSMRLTVARRGRGVDSPNG